MFDASCGTCSIDARQNPAVRILIVSQYFWPENFRINDLALALEARGHEVSVLTGQPNYPDGRIYAEFRASPVEYSKWGDARVFRIPVVPRGTRTVTLILNYLSFCVMGCMVGPWKLRKEPFDVIFVFQTSPITAALPAILLRSLRRKPVLMWVLDLWPDTLTSLGVVKSRTILALVGRLVRFIYTRCDRILVQSGAFRGSIEQFAGSVARMRYFPGWPEQVLSAGNEKCAPAPELDRFGSKFVVLFAGNIGESQDFPAIIDAAEALRDHEDVVFAIVGGGRAEAEMRQRVRQRGLDHRMVFLGRYPLERMPSFFCAAHALLVSLRDEGSYRLTIPGKVQSYLSAERPILGMLNGEGARVLEEAEAGFCVPAGEGAALADRIVELKNMSPEERLAMARSGKAYCERHFNRDMLVSDLEAWMNEVRKPPVEKR